MNFKSKGISGSVLQYLTLHIKSDLEKTKNLKYILKDIKRTTTCLMAYRFSLGKCFNCNAKKYLPFFHRLGGLFICLLFGLAILLHCWRHYSHQHSRNGIFLFYL